MPAYVIYARKSTESEDRQALSIDSQVKELRLIAAHQGVAIGEVLTEAQSAKAPGRPVFGELMRRIRRGEVNGILCWKMDRLARNHLDTGLVLQALAEKRLERVITSDRTYTSDGNDRFIGNFELGMATKYIDDLRANVLRGNRERFERGWVNHIPPIGYLLDPTTKTIVKDPDRFDLIRRMWELLLTGTTRPEAIRRVANEQWGLRTRQFKRQGGNPLGRATVFNLFGNPFYMGLIRLQDGRTYPGAHAPMVSRAEFDQAQAILGRPMRPRPQKHEFPFSGLVRCGHCGGSVVAEVHIKKSGKRFVYYRCSRRKKDRPCREPALPEPKLIEQFADLLRQVQIPAKIHAWLSRQAIADADREVERRQRVLATLREAVAGAAREQDTLLTLRLRNLLTDEDFIVKRRELEERRRGLEARLHAAEHGAGELGAQLQAVFDFATRAAETFLTGTAVQQRMILEAAGLNYTLTSRKVALTWNQPLILVARAAADSTWSALLDDVRTHILENGLDSTCLLRSFLSVAETRPAA
jgi:DNA invertase Pin-like site-specific DNA recombinase